MGETSLHHAAKTGYIGRVKALLGLGADPNARDPGGNTALHDAVRMVGGGELATLSPFMMGRAPGQNHKAIIQTLVEHGAAINAKNEQGNTPLHAAAKRCMNVKVFEFLLEHGADVAARNKKGNTPLHLAATSYLLEPLNYADNPSREELYSRWDEKMVFELGSS